MNMEKDQIGVYCNSIRPRSSPENPTKMSLNHIQRSFIARAFSTTRKSQFLNQFNRQLAATKPKEHVVEMLNKPIGLTTLPKDTDNNGDKRTIAQKLKDFLDPAKNKERQAELEKEISKSGMYDLYTYRKTKGKFFISPPAYWKAERAQYFPNFHGQDLTGSAYKNTLPVTRGKITVIRAFTSQIGEKSSQSFFKTLDHDYLTPSGYEGFTKIYPHSQIIDLNITENAFKAFFIKISKSALKKSIHQSRWNKYFIVPRKNISLDLREEIHLDNTYGGFIYVLDHEGKIRWAGCGEASDSERNLLWRTVRGLEREYKALNPSV